MAHFNNMNNHLDLISKLEREILDLQSKLSSYIFKQEQSPNRSQLPNPIDEVSKISIMDSLFIVGTIQLVAGSFVVKNPNINKNSQVLITPTTNLTAGSPTSVPQTLSATCSISDGEMTITSTSSSDTRTVHYLIIK